jgi:hypothetical protein
VTTNQKTALAADARQTSVRDQTASNLARSAEGGSGSPAVPASVARAPNPKADAVASVAALKNTPPCYTCKVHLKIAVFFDGTGNNLDADVGTKEHSNVARLFRAHPIDNPASGVYRIYVPGLGTYFKEIGDPGDEDGMAFGKLGEPRLQWAMAEIDRHVAAHPAAQITGLDIALFGFSRGAALARAFALRLQERCKAQGGQWRWDKGSFAADIYYMGLFDTVASVGLPASTSVRSALIATKRVSLDAGLRGRRHNDSNGIYPLGDGVNLGIAFGKEPGADPTPGVIDGHRAWAGNLRIPPMVKRCKHLFSTHEQRNSFPLDSAREGQSQPASVQEYWCPGVHSDVGGGYRAGEGGKSKDADQMLSLIPLIDMYDDALAFGVPFNPKTHPNSDDDFSISPMLLQRNTAYVKVAMQHSKGAHLEARMLANAKLLFAWRFKRIRERGANARPDASTIQSNEQGYAAEKVALDREIAAAQNDPARIAAQQRLSAAEKERTNARAEHYAMTRRDYVDASRLQASLARVTKADADLAAAQAAFTQADDKHMRLQARKATLPGTGSLNDNLSAYDKNLLLDVQAVLTVKKFYPKARVRPHYANLLEAYEAEYVRNKGLLDGELDALAFFDNYVHDSLAGFAKDETLPSDPRVVYLGGDSESQYAQNDRATDQQKSAVV